VSISIFKLEEKVVVNLGKGLEHFNGWGKSLERIPCFTRAEMNQHMANSGKRVANAEHHSIPTNFKES